MVSFMRWTISSGNFSRRSKLKMPQMPHMIGYRLPSGKSMNLRPRAEWETHQNISGFMASLIIPKLSIDSSTPRERAPQFPSTNRVDGVLRSQRLEASQKDQHSFRQ